MVPRHLYLAECPERGALKIGYSYKPERRLKEIRYATREIRWRLASTFPVRRVHIEKTLHDLLAPYRHPQFPGREYYYDEPRVRDAFTLASWITKP